VTRLDLGETFVQRLLLALTADEGRQASLDFDFKPCPRCLSRYHLPGADGLGLALHCEFAKRAGRTVTRYQALRRLGDDDLLGTCLLLQACRDIGRIANRGVVHAQVIANRPDDDQAGVEPL